MVVLAAELAREGAVDRVALHEDAQLPQDAGAVLVHAEQRVAPQGGILDQFAGFAALRGPAAEEGLLEGRGVEGAGRRPLGRDLGDVGGNLGAGRRGLGASFSWTVMTMLLFVSGGGRGRRPPPRVRGRRRARRR